MNKHTKKRIRKLNEVYGQDVFADMLRSVIIQGKEAFDAYANNIGRLLAEAILLMEREEISGPDYRPNSPEIQKWASQPGSVFIGDRKVKVQQPRLRGPNGEIKLQSYQTLKGRGAFSEELLQKALSGLSGRRYQDVVSDTAEVFGVSPSSVSRHIVEATAKQLKEFLERSLEDIDLIAIFLDTIHRGDAAFTVAIGLKINGDKVPLGFWEGATENSDVCKELFADLESRGLKLTNKILYITDGGTGIIKALKDKFGKKLAHQRCTIHKDRNIQKHLPKRYRKSAHFRFQKAMSMNSYEDAKAELESLEEWLRSINASAANSLLEAMEEILTLHRLNVPEVLRKTLRSTNAIESMFSNVRHCEKNIKRYRSSKMSQRWLGSVLLHCEKGFKRVKGYRDLERLRTSIIEFQKTLDKEVA